MTDTTDLCKRLHRLYVQQGTNYVQEAAAAIETLSVLAEARMDDEVLSGAEIEAVISGRSAADCDEAAGATRIKRLRDMLGNQMVSELLVKNIARRGYMLAVDKDIIQMV